MVSSCSNLNPRHLDGLVTILALPFDTTKSVTESPAPEASHSSPGNPLAGPLAFQVGKDTLLFGDKADKIPSVKSVCNLTWVPWRNIDGT